MTAWSAEELATLREQEELVLVIPWEGPGSAVRRVPVWVVVVDGAVYLRSWKGVGAGWYRRISAHPDAAVELDGAEVPSGYLRDDASPVAAISAEYLRKYGHTPYAEPMTLPTAAEATVRLEKA